jgi:hypothetical protein
VSCDFDAIEAWAENFVYQGRKDVEIMVIDTEKSPGMRFRSMISLAMQVGCEIPDNVEQSFEYEYLVWNRIPASAIVGVIRYFHDGIEVVGAWRRRE